MDGDEHPLHNCFNEPHSNRECHLKNVFFLGTKIPKNDGNANLKVIVYYKLTKLKRDKDQQKRKQDSYDRK